MGGWHILALNLLGRFNTKIIISTNKNKDEVGAKPYESSSNKIITPLKT